LIATFGAGPGRFAPVLNNQIAHYLIRVCLLTSPELKMQPTVAEPAPDRRQIADALTEAGIIWAAAAVVDRQAIKLERCAGPPLAHIMRLAHVGDSLPSSGGCHYFQL
jgi:hypothetical protein